MGNIYCIGVTGVNLSKLAVEVLFDAALYCLEEKIRRRRIFHDDIEGLVTTEFEYDTLGSLSGVVFQADFDCPQGSGRAVYLVRDEDVAAVRAIQADLQVSFLTEASYRDN